jgi:tRNA dimethylallyltransferase
MIICIVGPTGVGKSSLAIDVCQEIHGEIINGDAFQIYKEMNIGTAKPTLEERSLVPHHLFDYVDVDHEFSVYEYQQNLRNKIEELKEKNVPLIVCGGTGMYLKASFYDFDLREKNSSIDMSMYEQKTNEELHQILTNIDPLEAKKIHQNNRKRVLRAIQIYLENGKEKSSLIQEQKHELLYDVCFVGLNIEREKLNDLINKRVDLMFEQGLLEEVTLLMKKYPHNLRSFQAIGYKEIINGLDNHLAIDEIKELIKKNSRNYAKRQMTYFKNQLDVHWFDNKDAAKKFILEVLAK